MALTEETILDRKDKSSTQAHINMMQGIINRMAGNSANCKNWLVGIVIAVLALIADNKFNKDTTWVLLIPTIIFWLLDSYYLALERNMVNNQNKFLEKIENDEKWASYLFKVVIKDKDQDEEQTDSQYPAKKVSKIHQFVGLSGEEFFHALFCSASTILFYGIVILCIIISYAIF